MPRFTNISVALLRHGKTINLRWLVLYAIFQSLQHCFGTIKQHRSTMTIKTVSLKKQKLYQRENVKNFQSKTFTLHISL